MTELIAHRGASRLRLENTLPAFALALDQGADGIELDVHATRDGEIVVHHDPAVGGLAIADTPWSALREVQLGGGHRIPTLGDVLALAGNRATVYVEIKGAGIEHLVAPILLANPAKCAVHSFDHRTVQRHRRIARQIPTGVLSSSYPVDPIGPVIAADAQYLWQEWHLIDEELVASAHAAGIKVVAWTVNDARVAAGLVALGVDGLCGDDLDLLRPSP